MWAGEEAGLRSQSSKSRAWLSRRWLYDFGGSRLLSSLSSQVNGRTRTCWLMLRTVDLEVDKRVGRKCTVRDRWLSRSCYYYYYLGINISTSLHHVFIRSCQPAGEMVMFSLHSHWPPFRSSNFPLLQIWNFLLPTLCMPSPFSLIRDSPKMFS